MAFVADASMVAAWLMPDEQTSETDVLLDHLREAPALVPISCATRYAASSWRP